MEFTEIKCPKCGTSMMVNSELHRCTCNNCGMDIVLGEASSNVSSTANLYEQEKARLQAQKDFQDEQERIEQQRRQERELKERKLREEEDEREHQRLLDEVELPTPYGKLEYYSKYLIGGTVAIILLVLLHAPLWLFAVVIICAVTPCISIFYRRFKHYRHVMEDVDKYKEWKVRKLYEMWDEKDRINAGGRNRGQGLCCPNCGSNNITSQVFQENLGSESWENTSYHFREKGHGCLWWLLIGWWWWFFDLLLWFFAFIPRFILKLFASGWKRKKYEGKSSTIGGTYNHIEYATIHTCQNCGYTWES